MQTIDILRRLIAFPTVSLQSNLDLMTFVADYLKTHGIASELTYSEDHSRANLHAVIGPRDVAGVMLSGHTDVVPVDGQDWTANPFELRTGQERHYGRGTADMKGFIACCLAAVPKAVKAPLKRPIHLAFSYDEEIGCVGVRRMIDTLTSAPVKPAFCIVGEPTEMNVAIGHKGKTGAVCTCTGIAAHSALHPTGVNAIYLANDMITYLRKLQDRLAQQGPQDEAFEVPYSTIHVGTIEGGTALNIVPNHCQFRFEIRNLAECDPLSLIEEIRAEAERLTAQHSKNHPAIRIAIDIFNEYPGLNTSPSAEIVSFVKSLTRRNDHFKVAFGTEAGLFDRDLGVPAVVCGPGSMEQGHKADEFITQAQLDACDRFNDRLIDALQSDIM